MGPPSYVRFVVNRNVVMRRTSVNRILKLQAASTLRIQPSLSLPLKVLSVPSLVPKQVYCTFTTVSVLTALHMAVF
jgi:hypothetical protein